MRQLQHPLLCTTPKLFLVVLAVFFNLWLLLTTYHQWHSPVVDRGGFKSDPLDGLTQPHQRQVVMRTTPTNRAGIGSVIGQLRSSAAIATMLGASFATTGRQSEHHYQVASLLNLDMLENQFETAGKICSLMSLPNPSLISEGMETWCNDPQLADSKQAAHIQDVRSSLEKCTIILDDRPWDVRQDLSRCTWEWVKQVFSKLGGERRQRGGIGIHIRWGDMANGQSYDHKTPHRSIPIEVGARILSKIRGCGVQDELSVYMEAHNSTILDGLAEFQPYRLVDTGDDINDLLDLAANRVMILDVGSYTAVAHQIAEGGISVVPEVERFEATGYNSVLLWDELLDLTCDSILSLLD
ncbi:hypothetical protein CPB83DRAFT_855821 [Crepidotus variabilis]|uniref:Uncharacterized protein n=1 Tax=Crepidotus variabilis TaxID=179855 RepID=A0A9P6EEQ5_9AGAR|nr:hypothetical protein CPB83DRAFT_855821 [Crepidotus variabilis]